MGQIGNKVRMKMITGSLDGRNVVIFYVGKG